MSQWHLQKEHYYRQGVSVSHAVHVGVAQSIQWTWQTPHRCVTATEVVGQSWNGSHYGKPLLGAFWWYVLKKSMLRNER